METHPKDLQDICILCLCVTVVGNVKDPVNHYLQGLLSFDGTCKYHENLGAISNIV